MAVFFEPYMPRTRQDPESCKHALLGRGDIDHDDADLLPRLDIAVGIRNCRQDISPIDDRSELARLHAALQEADEPVDASRSRKDDSTTAGQYA